MIHRFKAILTAGLMTLGIMMAGRGAAQADGVPAAAPPTRTAAAVAAPVPDYPTVAPPAVRVSGQGPLKFRVFLTSERMPEVAKKVFAGAHGGSVVGLANLQHIHKTVMLEVGGKLYILTQSWNPSDFAILEQVTE